MDMNRMIMVSVDDHLIEPPELWDNLTAAQKAKAPKLVRDPMHGDTWMLEGRPMPNTGLAAVVGTPREEYGTEPKSLDEMRRGCWDVRARVDDMNANGILGSLCFGTAFGMDGAAFAKCADKDMALMLIKGYNDWHIESWCAAAPGRFIPVAIVPLWNAQLAADEVHRVANKGCHAIAFTDNPAKHGFPSIHDAGWEPFWKALADQGAVLCNHIGTGNSAPFASLETPIDAWIVTMPMAVSVSAADWLWLEALQRYPLKISLSEAGIGWLPYFMERADFTFEHHRRWTRSSFGGKRPSEVFREHFITCFIDDLFGLQNRHAVGVASMTYECDYPHPDTVWPESPERLHQCFIAAQVPDAEIDQITHLNAMRVFRYDPFSVLGRENCVVGALRALAGNLDTSPRSYGAARPKPLGTDTRVTSGSMVELMARLHKAA